MFDGATQTERFALKPTSRLLLLSPDNRSIAVEQWSPTVSILDATTGHVLVRAEGLEHAARCLAFSPDGKALAAGDDSGRVCIWDAGSGRLRASLYSGDRIERWGPFATALLVWIAATACLRWGKRLAGKAGRYGGKVAGDV